MQFSAPQPSPLFSQIESLTPAIVTVAISLMALAMMTSRRGETRDRSGPRRHRDSPESRALTKPEGKTSALERARNGSFAKKRLFNKSELRVFRVLEKELSAASAPLRVMGQTHMRAFVKTDPSSKVGGSNSAINGQHVDFAIADDYGDVRLVVEFNGAGHYRDRWQERDAIKKIAFAKAGIPLLVLTDADDDARIGVRLREALGLPPSS